MIISVFDIKYMEIKEPCEEIMVKPKCQFLFIKLERFSRMVLPVLILMMALTVTANLLGQEAEDEHGGAQRSLSEFQNRRQLNGHTFIPSRGVDQPFIDGWLRGMTGGAFASGLKVPILDLSRNQQRVADGKVTALLLDVEYQHRFKDWLAVRIGATGSARAGTNQISVLAQGITAQYGFNLGATVKIFQSQKTALSAAGDLRFNNVYAYNVIRFVSNVVNYGLSEDNQLLEKGMTNTYVAGLRFAFAPNKWFGFVALGEGGIGTPFLKTQDNSGVVAFAVSGECDLGAGTEIPLGFQVFLRWENFTDLYPEIADTILRTGLVIGYTGVAHFYAGIEIGYTSFSIRGDAVAVAEGTALNTLSVGMVMRHYF
jgi:hypothetical protein